MKILLCHNYYQQPGGEEQVFADEGRLLESRGHEVLRYTLHNDSIRDMGRWQLATKTLWNSAAAREVESLLRRERPQIMHCTNTFPLLSPAIYHAAQRAEVPVVQSLHNYRLYCLNSLFLRDGKPCELCLHQAVPWSGVVHGCYRGRSASAVVAAMLVLHRLRGSWRKQVDRFIALTEFAREKLIAGGLAADKISVKPNFVSPDPGAGSGAGGYAVFVGRLAPEKGLATLLDAWRRLRCDVPLRIVGDGPLAEQVRAAAATDPRVTWLGRKPLAEVCAIVGEAALLIMPSICYETFGRTIVEAYAKGTPVLAAGHGAMRELVDPGRTGGHFAPGDALDLQAQLEHWLSDLPALAALRPACRAEYEAKYTADANYPRLMAIYEQASRRP